MISLPLNGNTFVMLIMQGIFEPPESALDRVLSSNPHTCLVLPLVPALGRVRFSKLVTTFRVHTKQRGRDDGTLAQD